MKSQNRTKIKMFFSGIAAKYEENPEYFIGANVEFVSGGKKYGGSIRENGDGFEYSFLGRRSFESAEAMLDAVIRFSSLFVYGTRKNDSSFGRRQKC